MHAQEIYTYRHQLQLNYATNLKHCRQSSSFGANIRSGQGMPSLTVTPSLYKQHAFGLGVLGG